MVGFFSSEALAAVQRAYKVLNREAHRLIEELHGAREPYVSHIARDIRGSKPLVEMLAGLADENDSPRARLICQL